MTAALFLGTVDSARPGERARLEGAEARHACVVKRIQPGETIWIGDGAGLVVGGPVVELAPDRVEIVIETVEDRRRPGPRLRVVQALAKGERQELAVEVLTEVGVDEIIAWQADRSIVRWDAARGAKGLARWQSTAREASKQSRRASVPVVHDRVLTTGQLVTELAGADGDPEAGTILVLHEDATTDLADLAPVTEGQVTVIVGPEGGITAAELEALAAIGAHPVRISDQVLRASTAGAVALVQIELLGQLASGAGLAG